MEWKTRTGGKIELHPSTWAAHEHAKQQQPGTAHVIKGEPSATDAARLRHAITAEQVVLWRRAIRRRLRDFKPGGDDAAG